VATALTYRTGDAASKLRTVIVDGERTQVVLLPAGRLEVMTAKLLHGTSCAHRFWDEVLGTEGDDFAIPTAQIVQKREIKIAVKARGDHK
jgi:hypothetical protein